MKIIDFCRHSLLLAGLMSVAAVAQNRTQFGTLTNQERFPLDHYYELPQLTSPDAAQWKAVKGTLAGWGDVNSRYAKHSVPMEKAVKSLSLDGWRGEKVYAQAVVWTSTGTENLSFELEDLKGKGGVIPSSNAETGFVRYVLSDGIPEGATSGCWSHPDQSPYDSTMVADCIDTYLRETSLDKFEAQSMWLTIKIPADAVPGLYKGNLIIRDKSGIVGKLALSIKAGSRVLPEPKEWSYHLDLWQNPFAIARYYQVPLWSQAHLDAMRPIMERIASAGQKVITASIMHWPWNHQTHDAFESMITWIKRVDGSWEFKYDVFDKWVEFMMSCGIDEQIDCYSMVPWRLSFQYFDQATDSIREIRAAPGEQAYEDIWVPFLKDFAAHLRAKGWFDRTAIAMDERGLEDMLKTIAVVRKADSGFKLTLAGNYHQEIEPYLYDYCIGIKGHRGEFPPEVLARRKAEGKKSTYYTCCAEPYPNIFTFSNPAEAVYLAYNIAARGLDGYLRWAVVSWPLEPLMDSRYITWAAGDTYSIYPGNRSSIRFERLTEGIQDFEKIRILREEYRKAGNVKALDALESALSVLKPWDLELGAVEAGISRVKALLK